MMALRVTFSAALGAARCARSRGRFPSRVCVEKAAGDLPLRGAVTAAAPIELTSQSHTNLIRPVKSSRTAIRVPPGSKGNVCAGKRIHIKYTSRRAAVAISGRNKRQCHNNAEKPRTTGAEVQAEVAEEFGLLFEKMGA